MKKEKLVIFILILCFNFLCGACTTKQSRIIGSKAFTESYILSEIVNLKLKKEGIKCLHKTGLGGSLILWNALLNSSIDAYPEYTGTIAKVILKEKEPLTLEELKNKLQPYGIGITNKLGFNNSYALAIKKNLSKKLNIQNLSDLEASENKFKYALSHEFLKRPDGWVTIKQNYEIANPRIKGVEHNLAYKAIASNNADVIDVYSTDPRIASLNLHVLKDDKKVLPKYEAVYLYRLNANPKLIETLKSMEGKLDNIIMLNLNNYAEKQKSYIQAAKLFLNKGSKQNISIIKPDGELKSKFLELKNNLFDHLFMVCISMFVAILVGIPLGVLCSKENVLSEAVLSFVSIIQTIPSLALLAILVPITGISIKTAIIALFLYSLLPIVKNTSIALKNISISIKESAEVLGLNKYAQLVKIYLPISSPTILAGIKTSTILNIGTATLASLIGAGGLGEPIVSGLHLNDTELILWGAIPAAALALFAQFAFNVLDDFIVPKGLKLS